MENLIALLALTAMEVVLGIDNIVFITILTGRLPEKQQPAARRVGLILALVMRILLLLSISWIMGLTEPFLQISDWGISGLNEQMNDVSVKDLILFSGGLFLIWKSVGEIHKKILGAHEQQKAAGQTGFRGVIVQIALMDLIFSLDSVITAVGMAKHIWVMIVAVLVAIGVMMMFAEIISRFVERNPTLKMLALSFLILIGVLLVAEGIGSHFDKGYIYFAMAFALAVESLNLWAGSRSRQKVAS